MEQTTLNTFLSDMTYNSAYTFLEEGKDKEELLKIASKRGIKLPSHDLACFKCVYAFVDRMNKNGCTLPREEVEKSLSSLVGKAIDFDHFRKRVVGYWIDAEVQGEKIIAWGIFFKGNFQEDYQTIAELLQSGRLAISFEAWGNRIAEGASDKYSLTDIDFAGGALLLKESPAFPGSEVMEMANKERILEFAKVMTKPETFIHEGKIEGDDFIETYLRMPECGRRWIHDAGEIVKMLEDVDCSVCHSKGGHDLHSIDFIKNNGRIQCPSCEMSIDFTPRTETVKKGKRQITQIKSSVDVELMEDLKEYINNFEGTDEALEMEISKDIEGELEEAKLMKCMKCANVIEAHGNTRSCPKCGGSHWQHTKEKISVVEPEEVNSPYAVPFVPAKKLTYQERQNINDDNFAVVVTTKNKVTGEPRKIRMFPIHDSAHVSNALARLSQAAETLKKLGISQETVKNKILKRTRELNMEELLKKHQATTVDELLQKMAKAAGAKTELGAEAIADIKGKLEQAVLQQDTLEQTENKVGAFLTPHVTALVDYVKPEVKAQAPSIMAIDDAPKAMKAEAPSLNEASLTKSLAEATEKITSLTAELEKANADLKVYRDAEAVAEKAKVDASIKSRKDELGEFAKDMTDEDVLDEAKFELAKLKKENAELKKGKKGPIVHSFAKGSADKEVPEEGLARTKVDELAWGRDGKAVKDKLQKDDESKK